MSNLAYEHLHHNLKLLKLTTLESILDNYILVSIKKTNLSLRSLIIS
jgi:hypothetical protein